MLLLLNPGLYLRPRHDSTEKLQGRPEMDPESLCLAEFHLPKREKRELRLKLSRNGGAMRIFCNRPYTIHNQVMCKRWMRFSIKKGESEETSLPHFFGETS
jgi:hypothetical protein